MTGYKLEDKRAEPEGGGKTAQDKYNNAREAEKNMNKLKMQRELRELSQSQLAEQAEINVQTIRGYEQGQRDINKGNLKTLLKLCNALDCSLYDILDDPEIIELLDY